MNRQPFCSSYTNICKRIRMLKIVHIKQMRTGNTTVNSMDLKQKTIFINNRHFFGDLLYFTLIHSWPNVKDSNQLLGPRRSHELNSDCHC